MDKIRAQYREDWKSKEMRIRQRAVALYFIDKVSFLGEPVVFSPQAPLCWFLVNYELLDLLKNQLYGDNINLT